MALAARDAAKEQGSTALALASGRDEGPIRPPPSLARRIVPALLCVIADYYGLSAMVPMMPFHLQDAAGLNDADATVWFGVITSSQYAGVVLGCIFWGFASDRLGPMRSVQMTMVGNVATFALTGITVEPSYLLIVRIFAGFFSPAVPGLCATQCCPALAYQQFAPSTLLGIAVHTCELAFPWHLLTHRSLCATRVLAAVAYLFSVCDAADAAFAASANSLAILAGFGTGTASVALYEVMGFEGAGWLCSGIALAALATTPLAPAGALVCASRTPPETRVAAEPPPPSEGVGAALRSRSFLSQAASVSSLMLYFNGSQVRGPPSAAECL